MKKIERRAKEPRTRRGLVAGALATVRGGITREGVEGGKEGVSSLASKSDEEPQHNETVVRDRSRPRRRPHQGRARGRR